MVGLGMSTGRVNFPTFDIPQCEDDHDNDDDHENDDDELMLQIGVMIIMMMILTIVMY